MVCPSCFSALLVMPFVVANDVLAQAVLDGENSISIISLLETMLGEPLSTAIGEASTMLFSFIMVVVIARTLGYLERPKESQLDQGPTKPAVQSQAKDTKVPTAPNEKKKARLRSVATAAPHCDADRLAAAADSLANAVNCGRAAKLPGMLDWAVAHVSAGRPSTENSGTATIQASQQLFLSSVRACAKKRCFHEALAAYDHMKDRIGDGCSATWSLLLWSSVEAKSFDRGNLFAKRLRASGSISRSDFVNLVQCVMHKCKDVKQFIKIVEECKASGMKLDTLARNQALSVLTSLHAMDFAAEFLARTEDVPLDVVAYNTMMRGYSRSGEASLCLQLYEQMRSCDISPNEVTFGTLLDACVEGSKWEDFQMVFEGLKSSNIVVNVVHYTTYLKGLVGAGCLIMARDLLLEMHSNPNTKPDVITYSTLAKAYAETGSIDEAVGLLEMMRGHGVEPDAAICNTVLSACSVKEMRGDEILGVFVKVVSFGFKPTSSTYSVLIKACAKSRSWEMAFSLLRSAPSHFGIQPNNKVYTQLGQACATVGATSVVLQTYALLVEACNARGEVVDSATNKRFVELCYYCNVSPDDLVTQW